MVIYYKNLNFWLASFVTLFGSLGFAGLYSMLTFYVTSYLGQSPLYVSIYMVAGVLASMLLAPFLAKYSDRGKSEQKQILFLTSVSGIVSVVIFYFTTNYWVVMAINVSILAIAGSGWSLIVSYSKMQSMQFGNQANDAVMFNRAMFSLGWCVGPAMGGLVVGQYGFKTLFIVMLVLSSISLLCIYLLPPLEVEEKAHISEDAKKQSRTLTPKAKYLLLAFLFLNLAMSAAMILIPFHIVSIGGAEAEAGQAFAIAAFVEIPILIFSARLLNLLTHGRLLILIFAMAILTYSVMGLTTTVYQLFALQVFGGVMVALAVGIGMILIQDTMPDSPAVIMAHYSNMLRLATLLGTGLIGFFVEYFTTANLMMSMSVLPVLGMVVILVYLRREKTAS